MKYCWLIGLVLFSIRCVYSNCKEEERVASEFDKPIRLSGAVTKKYVVRLDRTRKVIGCFLMEDGFIYYTNVHGIWDYVEVGDSVIKDTGSLKYFIIRNKSHDTDVFYAQCNGSQIK